MYAVHDWLSNESIGMTTNQKQRKKGSTSLNINRDYACANYAGIIFQIIRTYSNSILFENNSTTADYSFSSFLGPAAYTSSPSGSGPIQLRTQICCLLLQRLCTPKSSELAQKRTVHWNPLPLGKRHWSLNFLQYAYDSVWLYTDLCIPVCVCV